MVLARLLWIAVIFTPACGSAGKTDEPTPIAAVGSAQKVPTVTTPTKLARDEAVLEAVCLHELRAAEAKRDDHVCLRVRGAGSAILDPSPALLAAIQTSYPSAMAASDCDGGGPQPVRTKTGAAAFICDIGPVIWDGPDAARVEGGGASRGGAMAIREVEYRVEATGNAFRVTAERVLRQN